MNDDDARLDALLSQHRVDPPSAALMRAVAEIPLRNPRSQWAQLGALWPLRRLVMGGALALSLGACAGYATAGPDTAADDDGDTISIEAEYGPTLDLMWEEGA